MALRGSCFCGLIVLDVWPTFVGERVHSTGVLQRQDWRKYSGEKRGSNIVLTIMSHSTSAATGRVHTYTASN